MHQTQCVLDTPQGSRFINLLCKHWRHKFTVEFDEQHGFIDLLEATCHLDAKPESLTVTVVTDEAHLPRWEEVLANHLTRYVKADETLHFVWNRSEISGSAGV